MSIVSFSEIKNDLKQASEYWTSLDPFIRILDVISLICVFMFGVGFILVDILRIHETVTNMAFLTFPIFVAGFTFVYRTKLNTEGEDFHKARMEFIKMVGIVLLFILTTFVYSFIV